MLTELNIILINILIIITILGIVFHFAILFKIISYTITWGGRIKNDREMYFFECISILVNLFFIFILSQKGVLIPIYFGEKTITIILWIFFFIFSINTIGNLFAKNRFEKFFAIITLANSILLFKIIYGS